MDEENDAPVSDEMIVIGEKRLSQENVAEPEEKKPEGSEPAATEPAVFKPAVSEPEESEFATSELETKESEVPAQNEVESVVSDEENESTLTEKTPIAEKVPSDGENSITEIPIEEEASSDEETPSSDEETDKRHVVLPRYLVIAASVVFLAMIGGFGWFAFNYGKMAAQRDHLALQLDNYQQIAAEKKAPAKSAPTQEEILRKKAIEDSVRMAQASEAVKKVEDAEQNMNATVDKQSIDVNRLRQRRIWKLRNSLMQRIWLMRKDRLRQRNLQMQRNSRRLKNLQKPRRKKKPESRQKSMLPRQAANTTRMLVFEPEPIVLLVFPR